ncbi:MAG: hypothetical protein ACOVOR_04735 [Rhabdochlamydiaceae bacterium]
MKSVVFLLNYTFIRILLFFLSFLPYQYIQKIGSFFGLIAYHLIKSYRKKAICNLSLASSLRLDLKEKKRVARLSIENLMITCLEYGKLKREKNINKIAICQNPDQAMSLVKDGKSPIFFCGHQSNWEVLFLEGTHRMSGVAIGRPIKNHYLYRWILSIREKFGGRIIAPKLAAKEGLKALRDNFFLGIVGDQAMVHSDFSSFFLGRKAWTSSLPALLSYKTGHPIIVATTKRIKGQYYIYYHEPLWPDKKKPMKEEVSRLMNQALDIFSQSVLETPDQWLWIHNRWKQQPSHRIKKLFYHDSLAFILDDHQYSLNLVQTIRDIYPNEQIVLFLPNKPKKLFFDVAVKQHTEIQDEECFKLVFYLTQNLKYKKNFQKMALNFLTLKDLNQNKNKLIDLDGLIRKTILKNP